MISILSALKFKDYPFWEAELSTVLPLTFLRIGIEYKY